MTNSSDRPDSGLGLDLPDSEFLRFPGFPPAFLTAALLLTAGCAHQVPSGSASAGEPRKVVSGQLPPAEQAASLVQGANSRAGDYVIDLSSPLSTSIVVDEIIARQRQKLGKTRKPMMATLEGGKRLHLHSGDHAAKPDAYTEQVLADMRPSCRPVSDKIKRNPRLHVKVRFEKNCAPASGRSVNWTATNDYSWDATVMPGSSKGDAWGPVRSGMTLSRVQHETLDAYVGWLREHPGSVDFLMNRAEPYLQYLHAEIRRHGLPSDLILVPMVESAFEIQAVSPRQAAGLWQFIPSTGQMYGLQLTGGYDGRYDVHLATQAALRYLRHLNELFNGDWLLTFAAYNAGEGAVQRAVQANRKAGGGGSFWELELPAETEAYVIKILCLAKVIAHPEEHGFRPHRSAGRLTLTRVEVRPEISVSEVIASSGMSPEDFYHFNPAFRSGSLPAEARHFLLPKDRADALNMARLAGSKATNVRNGKPVMKQS